MSAKRHPLADEIKKYADAPDEWQWRTTVGTCRDINFSQAMSLNPSYVSLAPKRSYIPAHLLPEGWEVERVGEGYEVSRPVSYKSESKVKELCAKHSATGELLRHIDPEADSD